jgi:hypothetical protein
MIHSIRGSEHLGVGKMATKGLYRLAPLVVLLAAAAQAPQPTTERSVAQRAEVLALEQAAAVAMRLESRLRDEPGERGVVPPIERPLLLFGDDPRNLTRGILWGWGRGRPVAVAELWRGRAENAPFAASLTLTGLETIVMTADGKPKWRPAEKQIAFAPVLAAPAPDAKEAARLRQLKEIARRFTAHEFWDPDNSRFELRLLVQPVHRYQDFEEKIQDGALFVLAHGTNPEVLLLIEAVGETVEKAHWQYGLVRTSNAETHVELEGKEVWTQPRVKGADTRPEHPYYVFQLPPGESAPARADKPSEQP